MLKHNNKPEQQSWSYWRWCLASLCLVALVLSAILSWHFLSGRSMVGCSGGSACDTVLSSRWSTIAGILPVSGLAMGVYLTMMFIVFYIGSNTELSVRRLAWKVLLVFAGSIAGSAMWFFIIQKWFIGAFCLYCMTTHTIGLIIAALIFCRAVLEPKNQSNEILLNDKPNAQVISAIQRIIHPMQAIWLIFIGLAFAATLAISQVVFEPSAVYAGGESKEKIAPVDYHDVPMIGSPDAPIVVRLLFDYQCSHCQKIHFMLNEAVHVYNGKLAFALCPTPLNTQCNPYIPRDVDAFKNSCELAKIGLAVWRANPKAFPSFENWMFTYDTGDRWHPRSPEAVREKAIELVGQRAFDDAWSNTWIESYLKSCVQLFGQTLQNEKGGIPKLVYGSRWVIPEPNNTDDLIRILQETLALPKPKTNENN